MAGFSKRQAPAIRTYADAERFLGGRGERAILNNTWIVRTGPDTIGVKLHGTVILTYCASGTVQVNSGGYQTGTTKDRLNRFLPLPYRVTQSKLEWTIYNARTGETVCEFANGLTLEPLYA